MTRFVFLLLASTRLFAQCDKMAISPKMAKQMSKIIFQGTIDSFRGSGLDRNVVFRVSRVWKGNVGPTFELPAIESGGALCFGFSTDLLAVGNELVVYARLAPNRKEYSAWPSQTTFAGRADRSALGRGHAPKCAYSKLCSH